MTNAGPAVAVHNPLFRIDNLSKRFPGVVALDQVSLDVNAGEVLGLVGENGAGKSTLIKSITGFHSPDGGALYFDGKRLEHITPHYSMSIGIACIYQELNLAPFLSVAENIFLGREQIKIKGLGWLDRGYQREETQKILDMLGMKIDPETTVGSMGVGHQQMVEIARAIRANAKMIIMDEPTASLSAHESEKLLQIIRYLKSENVSVIYISHHLEEVLAICDRITVLRDGKSVGTVNAKEVTVDDLVKMMVGRDITHKYPKVKATLGEEMLRVEHLERRGVLHDISFSVRAGEILGFAGLVGSGRTETARAITGADPIDGGKIFVQGKLARIKKPRDSIEAGIAFLTEDRKGQGLILLKDIEFNSTMVNLKSYMGRALLNLNRCRQDAEEKVEELRIRCPGIDMPAGNLSGGNQQKVVIAKWLLSNSNIFIFDEPTRGIDVGAKVEVYNLMNELVKNGAAVIMISSEMDECMGMSDRIIVFHEGRITAEFTAEEATQEKIMYAASGITTG
ncbi:MAG: sugar ABC transporter ATP-binding protein [Spirochaetaceae bacterium]|jgi:ribose transport system ATP-binding protein|nr:sugar ABC transporter ATP-binding protein [Spirochaetaceae bacterium]